MGSTFRIFMAISFILAFFLLFILQNGEASEALGRVNRQSRSTSRTCDCRYSNDSPVCASNGVTYPSMCRFNCAKERVRRLRVVANGSCNGRTLNDYRRGQKGRN